MQIRRVDVQNFRGIQSLSWRLPKGRSFLTLIGPGDSSKSTILTAIDMTLSDRWNLSINDTDFFQADVDQPISIRVTLADLPKELRRHDVLGMRLSGIDEEGELYEDPEDPYDACVILALSIDKELEPKWTVHRPGKESDELSVTSAVRRLIGAYKVDERIDAHLRWSRMSALGRLTEVKHGTAELLTRASRDARQSVSTSIPPELAQLTATIQEKLHALGSGEFTDLHAGLDQSLSNSTGNLALYEGPVPLTNFGLGSRRLAGVATQQLAHDGKAVLLVDEVEYGLEPHRLVGLLTQLRLPGAYAHVVTTTHSPTALQHLDIAELAIVRSSAGQVTVQPLSDDDEELQKLLRSTPEAFLARRIIVAEGKTEYGIALELLERMDGARAEKGEPSSAALGVVAVESKGGSTAIRWAETFRNAGYDVVLFIDSDVPADNQASNGLKSQGVTVVRWRDGFNSERAVCEVLDLTGLSGLIDSAVSLADEPDQALANFLGQLKNCGLPEEITDLDVASWSGTGVSIETARDVVAETAHKKEWFKRVDKGRSLAAILLGSPDFAGSDAEVTLESLRDAAYVPTMSGLAEDPGPEPEAEFVDVEPS